MAPLDLCLLSLALARVEVSSAVPADADAPPMSRWDRERKVGQHPATMTMVPRSSCSKMRCLLMDWMRALEKAVSVMRPICPPVKEIAS